MSIGHVFRANRRRRVAFVQTGRPHIASGRRHRLQANFLLFETASGYSLFSVKEVDNVALSSDVVQKSITDLARFSKIANLLAFKPFTTAVDALEQVNAVSESQVTDMLATFLRANLPKPSKKAPFLLGVTEPKLASSIQETTSAPSRCRSRARTRARSPLGACSVSDGAGDGSPVRCVACTCRTQLRDADTHRRRVAGIPCTSGEVVQELARGVRAHFAHYVKQLQGSVWRDAQRGLAHSYSRAKVKFNVNRADNMIIQVRARGILGLSRPPGGSLIRVASPGS